VSLTYYPAKEQMSNLLRRQKFFCAFCGLLRAAFGFLLEQRQQLTQLRGELFQTLLLFRSARRNGARVSRS